MSEARSVSFGLIFLLLCGTAYRYKELAANYTPPMVFGSGAPDELQYSASDLASGGSGGGRGAGPARSAAGALAADVELRLGRLSALRAENDKLRRTQEAMLASIGAQAASVATAADVTAAAPADSLMIAAANPVVYSAAVPTPAAAVPSVSTATAPAPSVSLFPLLPSPPPLPDPSPDPSDLEAQQRDVADLEVAAAAAALVPSGLRGGGLGGAAERAFALASSLMGSVTSAAARAPAAPAPGEPQVTTAGTVTGKAAGSAAASAGSAAVGSVVAFRTANGGRYLAVDAKGWLSIDMDGSSPLATRSFTVVPASPETGDGSGAGDWVGLQLQASGQLVEMVPKSQPLAWVIRTSGPQMVGGGGAQARLPERQQWRVQGGRLLNRESGAFVNVISPGAAVRGHGNDPNKQRAAGSSEPSTAFLVEAVTDSALQTDRTKVAIQRQAESSTEDAYIAAIAAFPTSAEKRVVSYGLYGTNPKYTIGAVRNAELVKVYFPGWVARFYCDGTVPVDIIQRLKALGSEIVFIDDIKGGIAGMFWRFLVADDPTVDRFIVRDSDSRLNARERFAVEDWIRSGKGVHSIRDHPNHDRPMNGGMWGGVHGAVKGMGQLVKAYSNKGKYGGDLTFLCDKVWPQIKDNQMSHDAYSCAKYPNAHPFPTRRPANYQHVGQVFFEDERWRQGDIDGFMKGRQVPMNCRKKPEWVYG